MNNFPQFRVGSLGSLLIELRRFYRELGYEVELAYVKNDGNCGCGESSCQSVPHFLPEDVDSTQRVHLIMRTAWALATNDVRVLHRVNGNGVPAPILRHGESGYVFVSDPENFPPLFPILGLDNDGWVSLPPHYSDDLSGHYSLPAWIYPLTVPHQELPPVQDIFAPSVFSRLSQLGHLRAEVLAMGGDGVLTPDEIVAAGAERVALEGSMDELTTFLAVSAVGGLITIQKAHVLIEKVRRVQSEVDVLHKSVVGVLFSQGDIVTGEIRSLYLDAAISLVDIEDDDSDNDGSNNSNRGQEQPVSSAPEEPNAPEELTTISFGADAPVPGDLSVWLDAPALESLAGFDYGSVFAGDEDDQGDTQNNNELSLEPELPTGIDWVSALAHHEGEVTPLSLVGLFLEIEELSLNDDLLTKAALVDMALTAVAAPPENPAAFFEYLWPKQESFLADLETHTITVQLLGGLLLRFEMLCNTGMVLREPSLIDQIADGIGVEVISELISEPSVAFWIFRHIVNVTTPELIAMRLRSISKILAATHNSFIPDVSTDYFLAILGDRIDD